MRKVLPIILLTLLVALPTYGQVRDTAGFFTPNAVERANQLISQTRQQTKRDLLVETIPSVPANQQDQLQQMGKDRFFDEYARTMARQSGITGVYVMICREPSYLKVEVGDATQRSGAFTAADRDKLRDTLVSNFKAKNYDQGLLDGVAQVQSRLTSNSGASNSNRTLQTFPGGTATQSPRTSTNTPPVQSAPPAAPPVQHKSGHGILFWGICLLIGFVIVRALLRRMTAGRTTGGMGGYSQSAPPPLPGQQQYPGQYGNSYPGNTGGGFGRGILGGLLGGAAGGWLYDRMGHRHDASSFPGQSNPSVGGNPDAFPDVTPDRDFSSSSGGEFSGGGGSDFSSGGGDFGGGGGDSGGGGGDSGGGGSF